MKNSQIPRLNVETSDFRKCHFAALFAAGIYGSRFSIKINNQ